MTDVAFSIDVVVDPSKSTAGTQVVDQNLARLERKAVSLNKAVERAVAIDPTQARVGVKAVEDVFGSLDRRVASFKRVLNDALAVDPSRAAAAARSAEQSLASVGVAAQRVAPVVDAAGAVDPDMARSAAAQAAAALAGIEKQARVTTRTVGDKQGGEGLAKAVGDGAARATASLSLVEGRALALRATLTRSLAAVGVVFSARQVLALAESYNQVQNRLRSVTASTGELQLVTERLFQVSNRTGASFKDTAELFARLGLSARELGTSQNQLLEITESLNQAIALSGASGVEASNGLIQFSQGLASGALRGDELRSVLEQLPAVADVIARSLGVTRGQLRQMGEEGKITSQVILNAFQKSRVELQERFAKSVPTLGQAFQVLRNNVLRFIGETDAATGATRNMAKAVLFLAENVETLIRGVVALGSALALDLAVKGVSKAVQALFALGRAVLANPLTALPGIIAAAIGALIAFGDQIGVGEGRLANLQDVAVVTFEVISDAIGQLVDAMFEVATSVGLIGHEFEPGLRGVLVAVARASDGIVGLFAGAFAAVGAIWDALPTKFHLIGELSLKAVRDLTESTIDYVLASFQTLGDVIRRTVALIGEVISNSVTALKAIASGSLDAANSSAEAAKNSINLIGQAITSIPQRFRTNLEALKGQELLPTVELTEEAASLGETVRDAFDEAFRGATGAEDVVNKIFDRAEQRASERARQAEGRKEERAKSGAQLDVIAAKPILEPQQLDLLKEINKVQDEYNKRVADLSRLYNAGAISLEEYNKQMDLAKVKSLEAATSIEAGFERTFAKIRLAAQDNAKAVEDTFDVFFRTATAAFDEFVETGKVNFRELAHGAVKELTKIYFQLLLIKALSAIIGGPAAPAVEYGARGVGDRLFSEEFGGARAGGGPVQARRSYLVGERGPELFTPNQSGSITPNGAAVASPPPIVNVTVANVSDPQEVPRAINSGSADAAIINVISRNKSAVRKIVA